MLRFKRLLWTVLLVLFVTLLGFFSGWMAGESRATANDASLSEDNYESLRPLIQSMALIRNHYVDVEKTNTKDLVYGAIKGMVAELDPYSQFMDPQSYKDMRQETKGSFGGLGIEIAIKEGQLTIITPIDGTPAQKAGILAGDKIIKIDGTGTDGLSIMDAVHKMRGVKGTKCVLTIQRKGVDDWFEVPLIRDIIKVHSVRHDLLDQQIGYIRITDFMERTGEDFNQALQDLEGKKIKGLILDLRNNPGGLLNMAAEIAEFFVPTGKLIVYTEGRHKEQDLRYFSTAKRAFKDGPLAVLINPGSASASEIVAGAIQDWNLGAIVGEKSFGKGSVQTIIPLGDGSALRITTARYLTPKGRLIHGNGITPDMVVEPAWPNEFTARLNQDKRFEDFSRYYIKLHPQGEEPEEVKPKVEVSEKSWEKLKPKTQDQKLKEAFVQWLKDQRVEINAVQLNQDLTLILSRIREEVARTLKGADEARKIQTENDPQVLRAMDAIKIMRKISGEEEEPGTK